MSRVHDALRRIEHKGQPEVSSNGTLSNLVSALIEELADEVPEDAYLEGVRADLLAANRSYESGKKEDIALRFYLAIRSLLHEHAVLQERLRRAESSEVKQGLEPSEVESSPLTTQ